jgi:hypothetical protein
MYLVFHLMNKKVYLKMKGLPREKKAELDERIR